MSEPLSFPKSAKFYILVKKDSVGSIILDYSTIGPTVGTGFYLNKIDVEQRQIILALQGENTNIYELEWPL